MKLNEKAIQAFLFKYVPSELHPYATDSLRAMLKEASDEEE